MTCACAPPLAFRASLPPACCRLPVHRRGHRGSGRVTGTRPHGWCGDLNLCPKPVSSATTARCLAVPAGPRSWRQREDPKRSGPHTQCKGLSEGPTRWPGLRTALSLAPPPSLRLSPLLLGTGAGWCPLPPPPPLNFTLGGVISPAASSLFDQPCPNLLGVSRARGK